MWGFVRIILLAVNGLVLAAFAYLLVTQRFNLVLIGMISLFVLNFAYLLQTTPPANWRTPNWRIFRLIGLWFDAKESELRRRAGQDK
jgi:hypothetical protein